MAGNRQLAGPGLSDREWKIIEALFRLMPESPRTVTYEDIVVKAWQLYPDIFGLRGYSERYPDASDMHKRLYGTLKSRGWVKPGARGQKKFILTPDGWERARAMFETPGSRDPEATGRATRTTEEELKHLERTDASQYYMQDRRDEILDTDFFAFYRTSVRADPAEFEGRLASVRHALDEALQKKMPGATVLADVDGFLRVRFADILAEKTNRKKREG